jgi:lysozyme family protein
MKSIQDILTDIIDREGRTYENVPGDRGGPTKFGITLGRLKTERGHASWEDVRSLTETEARDIYYRAYFERPQIDNLPPEIQPFILDWYVTSGTWAIKGLQDVLRDLGIDLKADGVIGNLTLDAAQAAQDGMGEDLLRALIVERAHFFGRIVANDEGQGKFIRGWINGRIVPFWEAL